MAQLKEQKEQIKEYKEKCSVLQAKNNTLEAQDLTNSINVLEYIRIYNNLKSYMVFFSPSVTLINIVTFSISLAIPVKISLQGISSPPCGRSAENLLGPITLWVMAQTSP